VRCEGPYKPRNSTGVALSFVLPGEPGIEAIQVENSGRGENWPRLTRSKPMGIILIVVLLVLLIGATPRWPYSRNWGYGPSGALGTILLIILILVLLGRI
jgi:hypothetical protein